MRKITGGLLAVVVFFGFLCSAEAGPRKWEYLVLSGSLKMRQLERMLNERGQEGWELVAFTRGDVAVFKRAAK